MEIITDILTGIQNHLVAVIVTGVFTIGGWLLNKSIGVFKEQVDIELRNYGFEVLVDGELVPVEE